MISPLLIQRFNVKRWWIALALLVMLAGCATQPDTWKASAIAHAPSSTIRLLNQQREPVGFIDRATAAKLLEIKNRIEAAAGAGTADLLIASGEDPNAFAGSSKQGPVVGINLAMIKLFGSDWDAYAAILGHEYAHLTLRHGEARQGREALRQGGSQILGAVLGAAGLRFGSTIADVATTAIATAYTRDEEREADRLGLEYARRAGLDPLGAVRAWQRMMSASGSFSIPFLSTHPTSDERLDTMRALAGSAAGRAVTDSTGAPAPARSFQSIPSFAPAIDGAEDKTIRAGLSVAVVPTESGLQVFYTKEGAPLLYGDVLVAVYRMSSPYCPHCVERIREVSQLAEWVTACRKTEAKTLVVNVRRADQQQRISLRCS